MKWLLRCSGESRNLTFVDITIPVTCRSNATRYVSSCFEEAGLEGSCCWTRAASRSNSPSFVTFYVNLLTAPGVSSNTRTGCSCNRHPSAEAKVRRFDKQCFRCCRSPKSDCIPSLNSSPQCIHRIIGPSSAMSLLGGEGVTRRVPYIWLLFTIAKNKTPVFPPLVAQPASITVYKPAYRVSCWLRRILVGEF